MRAKVPRFGWEWGEGERTVLRQIDHGEDDGGVLRGDFARLRGVSHTSENLTLAGNKKKLEAHHHDNLRFALITMVPVACAGPPSGEWENCRQSKVVYREPSPYGMNY